MPDRLKRLALDAILIMVAFTAAGALSGLVWKGLWDAPEGIAYEHEWYLQPQSYAAEFSGTGTYVAIATLVALVTSIVIAFVLERDEVVTLCAVLVGSALAAWVMYSVGHRLGPPDPAVLARTAEDYAPIPADLRVHGGDHTIDLLEGVPWWHGRLPGSPYLAWPVGAMAGLAIVYFFFVGRGSHAAREQPMWHPPAPPTQR